jgi:hypothetical protein
MSQLILRTNMSSLVEMVGQPVACEASKQSSSVIVDVDVNAKRIQDEKDRVFSFVEYLHGSSKWYNVFSNILLAIEFILMVASGSISSLSAAGYLETAQTSVKACISGVLQNSGPVESSSAMILECMKPSRASAIVCAILMTIAVSVRMFSSKSRFDLKSDNLKRYATMADGLLTRFNRLGTEESGDSLSVLIRESDALRKEIGDFITIKEMKKVFQNASNYVDAKVSDIEAKFDRFKEELLAAAQGAAQEAPLNAVAEASHAGTTVAREMARILGRRG